MPEFEYDNVGDRFANGFDAGQIRDGVVTKDPSSGHLILLDDDGKAFDPMASLGTLEGKRIRMTIISFEAIKAIESMLEGAELGK